MRDIPAPTEVDNYDNKIPDVENAPYQKWVGVFRLLKLRGGDEGGRSNSQKPQKISSPKKIFQKKCEHNSIVPICILWGFTPTLHFKCLSLNMFSVS